MEIYKALQDISKPYPLFSREEELVSNVSCWIHRANKSLIPENNLLVAEGCIEHYEEVSRVRGILDNPLTFRLRKILAREYNKDVKEAIK